MISGRRSSATAPSPRRSGSRFPVTFSLALGAFVLTILLGVPARHPRRDCGPGASADRIITFGTSAGLAMPDFWVAMILLGIFAVQRQAAAVTGLRRLHRRRRSSGRRTSTCRGSRSGSPAPPGSPASCAAHSSTRSSRTTSAPRGPRVCAAASIVLKHALKNAALVPVTVLGLSFAYLLGGTVIIERIFSLPGMGQYFYDALIDQGPPGDPGRRAHGGVDLRAREPRSSTCSTRTSTRRCGSQ